jgi:hypothetical protein
MDSSSIQILIESALVSVVMLATAVFMILKARDVIAPTNRFGSYDWGTYQNADRAQHQKDSNKPKHA